jgi:hypothetical protein
VILDALPLLGGRGGNYFNHRGLIHRWRDAFDRLQLFETLTQTARVMTAFGNSITQSYGDEPPGFFRRLLCFTSILAGPFPASSDP